MLDSELFLHFNWEENVLNGKTVPLGVNLQHTDTPQLEGKQCGLYVNRRGVPIGITSKHLHSLGERGLQQEEERVLRIGPAPEEIKN